MSDKILRWLPLAAIVFFALIMRREELDRRPMHADEANQAVKFGELLEAGRYAFDPRDHHGPTLYYAALPVAWIRGEKTLAALQETTVRWVPVIFGSAVVLLVGLLAWPLGRVAAAAAAAFAAVFPAAVYYSRYFIQETLLLAFTLAAIGAGWRWWLSGRRRWALLAGGAVGLMLATKASAPVFLVAALAAVASVRPGRPQSVKLARDVGLMVGSAVLVAALFYSSFGTHFSGLRDALMAPLLAAERTTGSSGHEKPWWYYWQLLSWLRSGGLVWEQLALCGLALGGAALALIRREPGPRAALIYTGLIGAVLSLTPYKTPWHVVHLVPGVVWLAAYALREVGRLPTGRTVAVLYFTVTILLLSAQTRRVAFLRAAEPRNPYAYVHSGPDVLKYRPLAAAALERAPEHPIRVIAEEYWPLPWYLRGLPRVGYWTTPPDDCDGALVISSASLADIVRSRLRGKYRESFLGLRPGVVSIVFTPEP